MLEGSGRYLPGGQVFHILGGHEFQNCIGIDGAVADGFNDAFAPVLPTFRGVVTVGNMGKMGLIVPSILPTGMLVSACSPTIVPIVPT